MAIREIEKKEWGNYFNLFSKKFLKDKQPEYAEIRILADSLGMQPETQWLLLNGITYDAKSDLLEIRVEKLNRLIHHPERIYVDEDENGEGWMLSFEVIQSDGTKSIIELR